MPVVGDVLQFVDYQSMANISGDVINVYYFRVTAMTTPNSLVNIGQDVVNWFGGDFLNNILLIQSAAVEHTRLVINDLMSYNTEFFDGVYESAVTGQIISEFASGGIAWSFQLTRQNRTTRNGSKRIAGVPETWVQNNTVLAANQAAINNAETALGETQWIVPWGVAGDEMTISPVIIQKPPVVTTPPTIINNVVGAQFRGIGSQNSRKQLLT